MTQPSPTCAKCGKRPDELDEYIESAADAGMTPDAYVRAEEGTYNPEVNRFVCTPCYCDMGMPSSPEGWKAP